MASAFADVNFKNRILIGYQDLTLGVNYIAALENGEFDGDLRFGAHRRRARPLPAILFRAHRQSREAVILNLASSARSPPCHRDLHCALKIYDFKRQLWGRQLTNDASAAGNLIRVDGTNIAFSKAQVGDEVTVLDGVNAGLVAHITSIANGGRTPETWTLDTTFGRHGLKYLP